MRWFAGRSNRGELELTSVLDRGNLSIRSLADVVSAEDFAGTNESEYLETALVAVPKCVVGDVVSRSPR